MAHLSNKPSTWANASLLSRQLFSLMPFVSYRFEIYLWPLLWKTSHIKTTIWVVAEEQLRRCQPYRKVEEAGLRKSMSPLSWSFWLSCYYSPYNLSNESMFAALLPSLHSNEGNELQRHLYLSSTESAAQGGSNDPMCQLRMSRLCK